MEKSFKEIDSAFNDKIKKTESLEETLNLYKRYYNFLYQKVVENEPTAEFYFYSLLSRICKFVRAGGFSSKQVSNKWNGGLAYRTIQFLQWYKKEKDNNSTLSSSFNSKFGVLYESIIEERDFISKIYCLSLLEAEGITKFSNLAKKCAIPIEVTVPTTNVD